MRRSSRRCPGLTGQEKALILAENTYRLINPGQRSKGEALATGGKPSPVGA